MDSVHVFISTGRFRSFAQMRAYIDPTYTDDGDAVPSAFMREVGLSGYEPACIEAILSETGRAMPLTELVAGASYANQWLHHLSGSESADAAICVYAPNHIRRPEACSLEYVGGFGYQVAQPK